MRVPKGLKATKAVLSDISTAQWAITLISSVIMAAWSLVAGLPAPVVTFLAIGTFAIVLMITHVLRISVQDWRKSSIPIAISDIRRHGLHIYPLNGSPPEAGNVEDPCAFSYGIVTVTNTSTATPVNLDIFLEIGISNERLPPLKAGPKDLFGRRLDRHAVSVASLAQRGMDIPKYFECPVHLRPGEAITATLTFLYEPLTQEGRLEFLQKIDGPEGYTDRLIVKDLVSGVTLSLPLPATYRGKAD